MFINYLKYHAKYIYIYIKIKFEVIILIKLKTYPNHEKDDK